MSTMGTVKRCGVAAFVAAAVMVSGCGGDDHWELRDVSGVMQDLEFELTRVEDGRTVTEETYEGKITVLFFGFTNCHDACPATLTKFSQALRVMDNADDVRFLFVSVDPERDTAEALQQRTEGLGEQFVGLRADIPKLREITRRYRVTFSYGEPDEDGAYEVSHSTAAFIFDRDGRARLLASETAGMDAVRRDLEALIRAGSDQPAS